MQEVGEQGLPLARPRRDSTLFVLAHDVLGLTRFFQGELTSAQAHLEQSLTLFDPQKHSLDRSYIDPELSGLLYTTHILWYLGYPDQARQRSRKALTLAYELAYPHSLAFALNLAATVHSLRGESAAAQEQAEAAIALCSEQGFPLWLAHGSILRGWALAVQGQVEEGMAQIREGLARWQAIGAQLARTFFPALLAETCGKAGETEEGLNVLAEALAQADNRGEHFYEAELHRLKGELLLESQVQGPKSQASGPRLLASDPQSAAEACFRQAIDIARRQSAKSLELRASTSLARLLHRQGKNAEAHYILAPIYGWFTEGFDTTDLQEARGLLEKVTEDAREGSADSSATLTILQGSCHEPSLRGE